MNKLISKLQKLSQQRPTMPKMTFLRKQLDSVEKHFVKGGKLERLHPLYDAIIHFYLFQVIKLKMAHMLEIQLI